MRHNFKELIDEYGEGEFPIKEMVEKLMTNTVKDDEDHLLPGIHPPEFERPLSSIFVDTQLPRVTNKHIPLVFFPCSTLILHLTPAENLLVLRVVMVLGAPLRCLLNQTKKSPSTRNIWTRSNGKRT